MLRRCPLRNDSCTGPDLLARKTEEIVITARIRPEVPQETVVLVADTQRAVDNIVAALREDGVYEDHAVVGPGPLTDEGRAWFDRGGWISGPCLDEQQ